MKKKGIFLEIVILITIIASIFTIYYIYKQLSNITPENSNSKDIINYSKNRKHKIQKNISETEIYKIPLKENIIEEDSTYDYYINSTDKLITSFNEEIVIYYHPFENRDENSAKRIDETILINYCNSFDDINSDYTLKCTYKNYKLIITTNYELKNVNSKEIKTKKFTIPVNLKYEDKLDELLKSFDEQGIKYQEIVV